MTDYFNALPEHWQAILQDLIEFHDLLRDEGSDQALAALDATMADLRTALDLQRAAHFDGA